MPAFACSCARAASGDAQHRFRHPYGRCLELRHESVATLVAMELELETTIRREIVIIPNKLDERHREQFILFLE
jgi:hypothetical protein